MYANAVFDIEPPAKLQSYSINTPEDATFTPLSRVPAIARLCASSLSDSNVATARPFLLLLQINGDKPPSPLRVDQRTDRAPPSPPPSRLGAPTTPHPCGEAVHTCAPDVVQGGTRAMHSLHPLIWHGDTGYRAWTARPPVDTIPTVDHFRVSRAAPSWPLLWV
jgi:hypothetical protein